VTFLGFELNGSGIKLQDKKVNQIMHWPAPQSVDELNKFLEFATLSSSHLKDFAKTFALFYKLLKKNQQFEWSKQCQDAVQKLKKLVTAAPVPGVPRLDKGKFILTCDGSMLDLGASLSQIHDVKEILITFWSKTLNAAQRNYCITHLELLAAVEADKAHHAFLAGAPFILRSDHSALRWLQSFKILHGRLARWVEQLSAYQMEIHSIPGKSNPVDALSCIPNRP